MTTTQPPERREDLLTVMSWNIHGMRGEPAALVRAIRDADADVVCLQETPKFLLTRHQLVALASRTGRYFLTGGRESSGTALLASLRVDVEFPHSRRVPTAPGWRVPKHGYSRATVGLPRTQRISITSFHLSTMGEWRAAQVQRLLHGLVDEVPAVLAGDLNERPGGPSWNSLSDWAVDPAPKTAPNTYRSRGPRQRIDAILTDPRLTVEYYGDPPGVSDKDVKASSDHRPVFAAIALPPR